jgi:hypothetical protein
MFFQVFLHALNKYAERNRDYQWLFPQDYDGRWKAMLIKVGCH